MSLLRFDLFGSAPHFYAFGQKVFKTQIGAWSTMCIAVLIIVAIGLFGKDFYLKETPRVFSETISSDSYDNITISPSNFQFMYRIEDTNGNYLDYHGSLGGIIVSYKQYFYNTTSQEFITNITEYIPTQCDERTVKDVKLSKNRNLTEWFCLNIPEEGVGFGGSWSANFVNYWSIEINNCPTVNNCFSQSEIENILNDGVGFSQYYPQYYFSPANLDSPLNIKYVNLFTYINPSTSFDYQLFWRSYLLEDDLGWILKDTKIITVLAFDYIEKGLGFLGIQESKKVLYFQSIFYTSSEKTLFHRSYMKIQELAALVGGFMEMILFIASHLLHPFSYYQLTKSLINNLLSQSPGLSSNPKLSENTAIQKMKLSTDLNNKDSQIKIYDFVTKNGFSFNHEKQQTSGLDPSFAAYMLSKLHRKKSRQITEWEMARKSLRNKMDITSLLKNLRKSSLIATLFLNNDQHIALNLALKQNIFSLAAEFEEENQTFDSNKVINYFQQRHKEKCITSLDNSLYLKLCDDLRDKIGVFEFNNN